MLYWLFFILSICFLSFFPEIQIPSINSKSRTVLPAVLLIQFIFCFIPCVCFMCICFYAFPAFHCFQSGSPMKIPLIHSPPRVKNQVWSLEAAQTVPPWKSRTQLLRQPRSRPQSCHISGIPVSGWWTRREETCQWHNRSFSAGTHTPAEPALWSIAFCSSHNLFAFFCTRVKETIKIFGLFRF